MCTVKTINDLFSDTVKRYPHKPALIFYDKTTLYHELDCQVSQAVDFLERHWIFPGERVALLLPNCPQFVIMYLAALRAGCVVVAMNPLAPPAEVAFMVEQTRPLLIVTLQDFAKHNEAMRRAAPAECKMVSVSLAEDLPCHLRLLYRLKNWRHAPPDGSLTWDDVMKCDPVRRQFEWRRAKLSDLAILQFTGGTTGFPKAAKLTHGNIANNVMQALGIVGDHVNEESVFLGVLPFFHVYALSVCLNVALTRGGTLVVTPRFNAKQALKLIKHHQVTILPMVSRMLAALVKRPGIQKADFSSVKLCVHGAGALHSDLRREAEETTGMTIIEGYGLSEASPIVSINPPENNRPGSLGKLVPETEAKIVDGELWVRGPQVMAGYWDNKLETENVLTPDGWLKTGDMVRVDGQGFYWMEDRKKDMVKRRGENVFTPEIEKVIMVIHGVAEAAVVGVPAKADEKMVACVVKAPNSSVTEHSIISWCRSHLPSNKVPDEVAFFDEFPKNILGKVQKMHLRNLILLWSENKRRSQTAPLK